METIKRFARTFKCGYKQEKENVVLSIADYEIVIKRKTKSNYKYYEMSSNTFDQVICGSNQNDILVTMACLLKNNANFNFTKEVYCFLK
ncbi:hypothetical protein [Staphylococcus equorum]|uniref:hypothetical protein n=1 Tax=Staphylococcus equorum TaxID=246432 RepID=UPI002556E7A0|nr:hypothetical protein [Staphylococcus equorum]MDK9867841.1 hypothetical protein [Staphylococcus equorum]